MLLLMLNYKELFSLVRRNPGLHTNKMDAIQDVHN